MNRPILPAHWALWGKSPRGTRGEQAADLYHPLIYHLVDVAMVAKALWPVTLAPIVRRRLANQLKLPDEEAARDWMAYWVGLHDIGKGAPGFAHKWKLGWSRIGQAGFDLPRPVPKAPHNFISTKVLLRFLLELGLSPEVAQPVAEAVGGHHGTFPRGGDLQGIGSSALGGKTWEAVRFDLGHALKSLCGLDGKPLPQGDLNQTPWVLMVLAGLTSIADWIGSDEKFFPYVAPGADLAEYADRAREQAALALSQLGWNQWSSDHGQLAFSSLFPFDPNPLQDVIVQLADGLPAPSLVLAESPMGGGKTEAALYLADRWSNIRGQHGFYFALPTQATSNQMFTRIKQFLARRYPEETVNIQLLHGHAALSAEFEAVCQNAERVLHPSNVDGEPGYDGSSPNLVAAEWFTRRKRGLLAPFGVGTVDQVLLSVLQTRHYFVRLFGVTGKTVIIDEVHAYDAYMTQVLERLLTWLASLRSSVVLLSATLPAKRRQELIAAFARGLGERAPDPMSEPPYPRVSWCSPTGKGVCPIPQRGERRVEVRWVDGGRPTKPGDPFPLGEELEKALTRGGCAAVICNTVRRAQQVYEALKFCFPAEELELFHARYVFTERDARERRTLARFGKDGVAGTKRPRRFVLVATQVVEQSLDIDFDLMVSEVAPVDLILQRAGRLHRHERNARPLQLHTPTLWLLRPEADLHGLPDFGLAMEHVYHPHILLRSWLALQHRDQINIPEDIEPLVEAVYGTEGCPGDLPEEVRAAWSETYRRLQERLARDSKLAKSYIVAEPDAADLLTRHNEQLEEENPEVDPSFQALTRLSEPSAPVVLLPREEAKALDLQAEPGRDQTLYLLGRSLTLTHGSVVPLLLKQVVPRGWCKSAMLRHHRLLILNQDRIAEVGDWEIEEHPELGVLIRVRGKESER